MTAPSSSPTKLRSSDDLAIVQRVAASDGAALEELFNRYGSMLLALARRILGAAGEAEEILQESFIQIWNQADRYDPARSSVSTWLILITRSRALDRLRSRQARDRSVAAVAAEPPRSSTSSGADESVLQKERRVIVQEALALLPPEQRQVLELAFYEGLSQSEIALRTGTPLGTVKTRALLGMKKMRQGLRPTIRELM